MEDYKEITNEKWDNTIDENGIVFSEFDKKALLSVMPNCEFNYCSQYEYCKEVSKNNKYQIEVNVIRDEWYLIRIKYYHNDGSSNRHFLCDQLFGMKQCIKDIKNTYGGL